MAALSRWLWLVLLFGPATGAFTADFQEPEWGASMEQIRASETGKLVRDDDRYPWPEDQDLEYERGVLGRVSRITYHFRKDKLVHVEYRIPVRFGNDFGYDDRFHEFKEILSAEFGQPFVNTKVVPPDRGGTISPDQSVWHCHWATATSRVGLEKKYPGYFEISITLKDYSRYDRLP